MTTLTDKPAVDVIGQPSNDGAPVIATEEPYAVEVTITGSAALLLHAWSCDAVEAKSNAKKGSAAKKSDDVESYVRRDDDGHICLPGVYLIGSMTDPRNGAAKYRQDPRSPRKSALDLFRAGVVTLTDLAPITAAGQSAPATEWDYLDRRRVTVQRAAITRVRPAFHPGWSATVILSVLTPEYIDQALLVDVLGAAGRLVGVGDFRPTFGRYSVTAFNRLG